MLLDFLKTLATTSNYILLWLLLLLVLFYYNLAFKKTVFYGGVVVLLVATTTYVPRRLLSSIERQYLPLDLRTLDINTPYYVMVLGSGTSWDADLPPSMNLSTSSLTRLAEGIRVFHGCTKATLITSAAAPEESPKSQAQIVKEAAMGFGIDSSAIRTLDLPRTTLEEALAFKAAFGIQRPLIVVTSALHMPRAVTIFKDLGVKVIAAPTDYQCLNDERDYKGLSFPRQYSLQLTNAWQSTVLKLWYYQYITKPAITRQYAASK